MTTVDDAPEINASRQAARVCGVLGGTLSVLAVGAGLALLSGRFGTDADTALSALCWTTLIAGGVLAGTLLLVTLLMGRSARAIDRLYDRLRGGEILADWRFGAEEWGAFVLSEQRSRGKELSSFAMILVVCFGAAAAYAFWLAASSDFERVRNTLAIVVATAALAWLMTRAARGFAERGTAALRRHPRVLIGADAVSCGGALHRWNADLMVLRGVRMVSEAPMLLELTIGTSQTVRNAGLLLNLLAVATGTAVAQSDTPTSIRVPVPADRADEGVWVMEALLAGMTSARPGPAAPKQV